jgi:tyrosyl-tRNA synthetase
LENAKVASSILFGKATEEALRSLDAETLLSVFEGVPQFTVSASELEAGIPIIDFTAQKTQVFASNGEARRMIQGNGLAINKTKVTLDKTSGNEDLIAGKYDLVQKGKKNYFLVTVE